MKGKRFAIDVNHSDEFQWILTQSQRFAEMQTEAKQRFFSFPLLLQDIFYSLYKDTPVISSYEMLTAAARLNRFIVEQLIRTPEFRKARGYSKGNMLGSGMFTLYFAEAVLHYLDPEVVKTVNEIVILEEELAFSEDQRDAANKVAAVARAEGLSQVAEAYKRTVEYWKTEIEIKSRQLRGLSAQLRAMWNTSRCRRKMCMEAKGLKGDTSIFDAGTDGAGLGKGLWYRRDYGPILNLTRQYLNSPKLVSIAARVTQLKAAVTQKSRHRLPEEDILEIRGINYGDDISNVVPEEVADYFLDGRKSLFLKRLSEENLSIYEMTGDKKKVRGPLVICLDNSGSMQGAKEITGKAIAVAAMEIACRQKRDTYVIMFGGTDDSMNIIEIDRGRCSGHQITQIAECFLCSPGTDFEKPLEKAVDLLEKSKYPGGDIVFITDGACNVSSDFIVGFTKRKKKRGFKTTSVVVGYGCVSVDSLQAFSDELLQSRELTAVDVADGLFEMLQGE